MAIVLERTRTLAAMSLWALAIFGTLAISAVAFSFAASAPKPVVVDTDMAPDDWIALLFLLQRPDVDVVAITVVGTGEAHCRPGVANAMRLLALAGKPGIKVACGQQKPLQGTNTFPADWRKAVDGMFGLKLAASSAAPTNVDAVELLRQSLDEQDRKVTLVTLGPVTNIARLIEISPASAKNIGMIYVMGGALNAKGNLGPAGRGNVTAEWNIFIDPEAALEVVKSGIPITMIALDATDQAPITMAFHDRLGRDATTTVAKFVYQILDGQKRFIESGNWYFWDPLAAVAAVDEGVVTLASRKVTINVQKGQEFGRVLDDNAGAPVRVAVGVDANLLQRRLVDVLNGRTD
jgi:inosine-uridine nucleoside N-ribohydrolase